MKRIEAVFHYEFKDMSLLERALTHKSYSNEKRLHDNNEKLEFVGDAVIDLVLADELYKIFPHDDEGGLSKKRASLVNESILAELAQERHLHEFLRLGKGELQSSAEIRPRLLASAFEAVMGAIYLDGGYERVQKVILTVFAQRLHDDKINLNYESDFKSRLQEQTQKKFKEAPVYHVVEERGAPHEKVFVVEVILRGKSLATAEGRSKKEAEQKAAELALQSEGVQE